MSNTGIICQTYGLTIRRRDDDWPMSIFHTPQGRIDEEEVRGMLKEYGDWRLSEDSGRLRSERQIQEAAGTQAPKRNPDNLRERKIVHGWKLAPVIFDKRFKEILDLLLADCIYYIENPRKRWDKHGQSGHTTRVDEVKLVEPTNWRKIYFLLNLVKHAQSVWDQKKTLIPWHDDIRAVAAFCGDDDDVQPLEQLPKSKSKASQSKRKRNTISNKTNSNDNSASGDPFYSNYKNETNHNNRSKQNTHTTTNANSTIIASVAMAMAPIVGLNSIVNINIDDTERKSSINSFSIAPSNNTNGNKSSDLDIDMNINNGYQSPNSAEGKEIHESKEERNNENDKNTEFAQSADINRESLASSIIRPEEKIMKYNQWMQQMRVMEINHRQERQFLRERQTLEKEELWARRPKF